MDSVVPVIATRQSMTKLGLPIVEAWRPWSADGEQVYSLFQYNNSALETQIT